MPGTDAVPYLGICLGMQIAIIEYARNVAHMTDAHSTSSIQLLRIRWSRSSPNGPRLEATVARSDDDDLGGTMRLWGSGSTSHAEIRRAEIYGATSIFERHRHRMRSIMFIAQPLRNKVVYLRPLSG